MKAAKRTQPREYLSLLGRVVHFDHNEFLGYHKLEK
jgi:hypothetical protein